MKKIYVFNLDSRRLVIVTGAIITFVSLSLMTGMKIGSNKNIIEANTQFNNVPSPQVQTESTTLALEPLVHEVPETNNVTSLAVQDDPFILAPPKREKNTAVQKPIKEVKKEHHKTAKKEEQTLKIREPKKSKAAVKAQPFYTIQVAAFVKEQDARNLNTRLIQRGFASRVERGTRFWFVRVGKESSTQKLETSVNKLRKESFDALIKRQAS